MASSTFSWPLHICTTSIGTLTASTTLSQPLYNILRPLQALHDHYKYTVIAYIGFLSEVWRNSRFIASKFKVLKRHNRFIASKLRVYKRNNGFIGLERRVLKCHHRFIASKKRVFKWHYRFIASKRWTLKWHNRSIASKGWIRSKKKCKIDSFLRGSQRQNRFINTFLRAPSVGVNLIDFFFWIAPSTDYWCCKW